jgi:Transposase DDE domain
VSFARAAQAGLLAPGAVAAVDATGLDARHASTHYRYGYTPAYRAAYARLHAGATPAPPHHRPGYPKLTIVVHTHSHLIAGALPGWGPSHDTPGLAPVLRQAAALLRFWAATADAGYDAEHVHRFCREELGMAATAVALNRRTARRWPRTPYRRAMRRAFPRTLYAERQQVESVFSRDKRRLGAALTARTRPTLAAEQVLRVLTHNLLILQRAPSTFQQSR